VLDLPVPRITLVVLGLVVAVPFLALLAAVPVAWGLALSSRDLAIGLVAYLLSGLGATVGFHRYFTHGSFKAARWLRVALAVAGGFLPGQLDPSAWLIWLLEMAGWGHDVHWPKLERFAALRLP
jgi:fatty-acid desaturase